ncbi:hypothetical protein [Alicyclobacillus fodiniaquatilis]|jgi:hypothetical protein|uniref:ABC transporter substrate-binding protein n=1 Tax=Alicyclobacillus fodiniaquatilis TaxID=1661150 RepID=A0ABW4JEI5_9BACL
MTVRANQVYLYGATATDYLKCLAAADVTGVPTDQCLGDYQTAWEKVSSSDTLVLAVGGAALYALYYNPCNWSNPAGEAGGHTPFEMRKVGQGIKTLQANTFVNAAGYTSLDSLTLAVMLSYYAVHGVFPNGYGRLPRQEVPQQVCARNASPSVPTVALNGDPKPTALPTVNQPSVGIYASIMNQNDVKKAIQLGWEGIGVTAALGTTQAPFTQVLPGQPDLQIAQVMAQNTTRPWWLSFWTVSWPSSGTTFLQAGRDAGEYAAQQIEAYPADVRPNYVILDPEGYNSPAQTIQQFHDFINGFAAGVTSVNAALKPGFYCNQSQYQTFQLAQAPLPAFIAIAPVADNQPMVKGSNIRGYIAYYADSPAKSDVTRVKSWGALYNTLQFRDSGIDCGPT